MNPAQQGAFLTNLTRDASGNTLAIAAASIFALMGVVGGAVDISRTYMAQSRLQQACDAGALAARKAMAGETLTNAEKATGYRYFDFNFPAGSYGVTLTSRTYTQPTNSSGTPQAIVNGTVVATVPTTIMKVFGKTTVDLNVQCSSKMDIANADVAMVLDVTGSMTSAMKISSSGTATEQRIDALRKAVKAFYDALGPGRAGGDLSKGRIRYAFIPYGTVVNVGHLLTHDQMVDSASYQSVNIEPLTVHTWTTGSESGSYGSWSTAIAIPAASVTAAQDFANYTTFDTSVVGTGSGNYTYTKLDGTTASLAQTISGATSGNCASNNNLISGQTNLKAVGRAPAVDTETIADTPPNWPSSSRVRVYTTARKISSVGYRYRWFKVGTTNACRLESGFGDADTTWTQQSRTKNATQNINWTDYTGAQKTFGMRTIDVSSLKAGSGWNSTITISGLNRTGTVTDVPNVRKSGSNDLVTVTSGGTPQSVVATWRGCVEERQIDNTITGSTGLTPVPANAYDLNSTILASTGDDATRWRPWLWKAVFAPNATLPVNDDNNSGTDDEQCPAPAIRLQEIGNYNTTILDSNYPALFQATSGAPASYYYPYTTSQWGTSSTPAAERTKNTATLRNYIDRIKLYDGTTHDAGFIWGLHLVSGEGMFASDNPDRFNGQLVSRNIVFMTDGEMNPGEERYVFSGYNQYDGRLAPTSTTDTQMKAIENRRLRIMCEEAKSQGITVWVVAITSSSTDNYDDLRACASPGKFKSAATSTELIASFTNIAQSIGGLRISR